MKQRTFFSFPQNVFILSLVSLLNDIGGQTIKYAIPLFLANVLGVKTSIIGLVEGIGEATPHLLQPVSGWLSDRWKRRKPLVILGQSMRSLIILLYIANTWIWVLVLRFIDRTGKGIQAAPRDALLSVSAQPGKQGRAFGLSRTLDNAGAVIGLILAALITIFVGKGTLSLTQPVFQAIVLFAFVPMALAVCLIAYFVRDVEIKSTREGTIDLNQSLSRKFYTFLVISFLFTMGNASDAFLILRSQQAGLSLTGIFLLLASFSLVGTLTSLPAGILSDRIGRKKTILFGWLLYSGIYFGFAVTNNLSTIITLFLLYGVYYGFSEGTAKAYVADIIPSEKKGVAFGFYNMTVGLTLFPASLLAGFLWQTFSPSVAFTFGGILALIAATCFLFFL